MDYGYFIFISVLISFSLHTLSAFMFTDFKNQKEERRETVKIKIVSQKPEINPAPIPVSQPKKNKQQPSPKQASSKKQKESSPPIQGLSKNSIRTEGEGGVSVPIGNTLLAEDKGIRKEEVDPVSEDLSARAKLLEFVKPEYTSEALGAEVEGNFIIDAFVDEMGKVVEAEMRKKVGYGMDERLLQAAFAAVFSPRRDEKGNPLKSWEEIVVNLSIR